MGVCTPKGKCCFMCSRGLEIHKLRSGYKSHTPLVKLFRVPYENYGTHKYVATSNKLCPVWLLKKYSLPVLLRCSCQGSASRMHFHYKCGVLSVDQWTSAQSSVEYYLVSHIHNLV